MRKMAKKNNVNNIATQAIGATVDEINRQRVVLLYEQLDAIKISEQIGIRNIDRHLLDALGQVERVRNFIGTPNKILGSMATKHGEIAEEMDVAFQNAWDIMKGLEPRATFDGVGRTAPEDYLVFNIPVQSKYINGASNTLSHVIEHLEKYKDIGFGRDASYYVIPKDQYGQILNILDGNKGDFSEHTINAIKNKVDLIENMTGKTFSRAVHSGTVNYAEVQLGKANETLTKESIELQKEANKQLKDIMKDSSSDRNKAIENSKPSTNEAMCSAAWGAGISGTMQFALELWSKKNEKGNWNLSRDDWKSIFKNTGIAVAKGGVSGYSIYQLTNNTKMSGAEAAGFVSATFGVSKLFYDYQNGNISETQFSDGVQLVCINSAVSTIGSALGQTLIPIPVLGAVIGSTIANQLNFFAQKYLSEKEKKDVLRIQRRIKNFIVRLDYIYQKKYEKIMSQLQERLCLMYAAFENNIEAQEKFKRTLRYANKIGVDVKKLLQPQSEEALKYFCN